MSEIMDQPAPRPNVGRPIWELVIADMRHADPGGWWPAWQSAIRDAEERDQLGRRRYGTPLQADNGRDALIDAYQETLDQVVYLRQAIEEGVDVCGFYARALDLLRDMRGFIIRRDGTAGPVHCAFCGRSLDRPEDARRWVGVSAVCDDPQPTPDKPTPTPCAWKLCARATGGAHNFEGETGPCKDCGRPREVRK